MHSYLFAGLLGVFVCLPSVQAQSDLTNSDEQAKALQATISDYEADYNSGDVGKVMGHWAETADFVDIHGNFHEGRDLISALFRRGFADNPGRKIQFTSLERKVLSPTLSIDDGALELTDSDGDKHRGRYTVVWTKAADKWLILSARDIPIEEKQDPQALQAQPLEELAWLIGEWQAKSEKYEIQLHCDWQLDKNYLVQEFNITADKSDFRVVTYITYDPLLVKFRSWYFDSRGGFGGGTCTRRSDEYIVEVMAQLPDGGVGSSVMIWKQDGADSLIWRSTEREVGGESLPDAKQTYVRVK